MSHHHRDRDRHGQHGQANIQEDAPPPPSNNTRIIGGSEANAGDYPWFARAKSIGCGGSLISSLFVLTAAHCGFTVNTGGFQIGALCSVS